MPKRVLLPPALTRAPFAVRDARAAGIGEGRLYGPDLSRPFHGVRTMLRVESDSELAEQVLRCLEYAPLLRPGLRFSHLTAARLWGSPLVGRVGPLHVTGPGRAPRSSGMIGHHSAGGRTVVRHGVPTSDPVTMWLELAAILPLDDLVVVGDHLVLEPRELDPRDIRPYSTIDELSAGLAHFHGRGAAKAAEALAQVRQGSESRPETLLRLLQVRGGLPEPELQVEIVHGGRSYGWVDQYHRRWRTAVEYDGDWHRTSTRQYERDILRIEDLERVGERVIRVRKSGLFTFPGQTLERIERDLRERGWDGASTSRQL